MNDEEYREFITQNAIMNRDNLVRQAKILDMMEDFWPKFIEQTNAAILKQALGDENG